MFLQSKRLVAAARELRDQGLEQVNPGPYLPKSAGKYDISRQLHEPMRDAKQTPLLTAA